MDPIFNDTLPPILDNFPLEKHVEGLSDAQKKAWYKGFSKAYTLLAKAVARENAVYILPKESADLFGKLSDKVIDILNEEKEVPLG